VFRSLLKCLIINCGVFFFHRESHFWHQFVTYSGVLFTMELYCTPKVNTLQLNTASNSSNTRTRPTCTTPEHSFL
jgi:hypothetical protein